MSVLATGKDNTADAPVRLSVPIPRELAYSKEKYISSFFTLRETLTMYLHLTLILQLLAWEVPVQGVSVLALFPHVLHMRIYTLFMKVQTYLEL